MINQLSSRHLQAFPLWLVHYFRQHDPTKRKGSVQNHDATTSASSLESPFFATWPRVGDSTRGVRWRNRNRRRWKYLRGGPRLGKAEDWVNSLIQIGCICRYLLLFSGGGFRVWLCRSKSSMTMVVPFAIFVLFLKLRLSEHEAI
jgi:hypothetical protein